MTQNKIKYALDFRGQKHIQKSCMEKHNKNKKVAGGEQTARKEDPALKAAAHQGAGRGAALGSGPAHCSQLYVISSVHFLGFFFFCPAYCSTQTIR